MYALKNLHDINLYRRIQQLRMPPLCMLALGKTGEETYSWDSDLHVAATTDRQMSGSLMDKQKSD